MGMMKATTVLALIAAFAVTSSTGMDAGTEIHAKDVLKCASYLCDKEFTGSDLLDAKKCIKIDGTEYYVCNEDCKADSFVKPYKRELARDHSEPAPLSQSS